MLPASLRLLRLRFKRLLKSIFALLRGQTGSTDPVIRRDGRKVASFRHPHSAPGSPGRLPLEPAIALLLSA